MSRIRSIKPEFWSSEQVMECSVEARLLFIGLWNFCDDYGRHPFAPMTIKAQVFPNDDFDSTSIRRMLDELSSNGLIFVYEVENKQYLEVTGWHHQKIDRKQRPKFPAPPAPEQKQDFADDSTNDRRILVDRSEHRAQSTEPRSEHRSEPRSERGKGGESEGGETRTRAQLTVLTNELAKANATGTSKIAVRIPPDLQPNDADRMWAEKSKLFGDEQQCIESWRKFVDHHHRRGGLSTDWHDVWKNDLMKTLDELERQAKAKGNP